jgi:hypothetical protein
MAEEPMDDFIINIKIRELFQRKDNKENAIMKAQAEAKMKNGIN